MRYDTCLPPSPPPPPVSCPTSPPPSYTCTAKGDPHYETFSRRKHNFYDIGLYEHARFRTKAPLECEVVIQTFLGSQKHRSMIVGIAVRVCDFSFEFIEGTVTVRPGARVFNLAGTTPGEVWASSPPTACGSISLNRVAFRDWWSQRVNGGSGWRLLLPGRAVDFLIQRQGAGMRGLYNTWLHVERSVINQPPPGGTNSGLCFAGCPSNVMPGRLGCNKSPARCYPVLNTDKVFVDSALNTLQRRYFLANPSTRNCGRRLDQIESIEPPSPPPPDASNSSFIDACAANGIDPTTALASCETGCGTSMDEDCAYDLCTTGDSSFIDAYKGVCAIDEDEKLRLNPLLSPPSPPPPILSVNCAALNETTTCRPRDWNRVHKRCSPTQKPHLGGVNHPKCAKLCNKKNKKLSATCKQACCGPTTPPSTP